MMKEIPITDTIRSHESLVSSKAMTASPVENTIRRVNPKIAMKKENKFNGKTVNISGGIKGAPLVNKGPNSK